MTTSSPERLRVIRPLFDRLSITEAAYMLANFCLTEPEYEDCDYAVRSINEHLVAAIATRTALGPSGEYEQWVSSIRIASNGNPFKSPSGLEIKLPYGLGESAERNGLDNTYDSGVYASYPFDGMGWNGHSLFTARRNGWVDPESLTVSIVDDQIVRGRPGSPDEWVGFYLSDVVDIAGS